MWYCLKCFWAVSQLPISLFPIGWGTPWFFLFKGMFILKGMFWLVLFLTLRGFLLPFILFIFRNLVVFGSLSFFFLFGGLISDLIHGLFLGPCLFSPTPCCGIFFGLWLRLLEYFRNPFGFESSHLLCLVFFKFFLSLTSFPEKLSTHCL